MVVYWALFAYFALGALLSPSGRNAPLRLTPALLFGACATAILIGFRYRVGGDWDTYQHFFRHWRMGGPNAPPAQDPAYQFLNMIVDDAGLRIWAVNLVCGAIFTWGLFRFCAAQKDPWLAVLVSVPYMIIVVAMGYTRQAVALGILMAGLAQFQRGGSTTNFSGYVGAAALFHRTAVMSLPLVGLASPRNKWMNLLIALSAGVLLYDAFLGTSMDKFMQNYVRSGYSSSGAGVRLAMNAVAAAVFVLANKRLEFSEIEWRVWRNYTAVSFLLLAALFVVPSSTAVDRMSIYVMPLQIAVISRLPLIARPQALTKLLVISYLAAVQFVWLNFAQHAEYWVPYRFYRIWDPSVF